MSIPLVQNNEKDSINTSIIAIKRNIERINMLLGLSNSEEIDTSKFATKDELQQAVTDLQPVNKVAIDNMQSVTSNAVANIMQSAIALVDSGYNKIDASQSNFVWRSATLCSINIYDNTKTGISVDFDFGLSQIRVFTVVNGVTMGQKNVNLS